MSLQAFDATRAAAPKHELPSRSDDPFRLPGVPLVEDGQRARARDHDYDRSRSSRGDGPPGVGSDQRVREPERILNGDFGGVRQEQGSCDDRQFVRSVQRASQYEWGQNDQRPVPKVDGIRQVTDYLDRLEPGDLGRAEDVLWVTGQDDSQRAENRDEGQHSGECGCACQKERRGTNGPESGPGDQRTHKSAQES